jgi:hypothetical protein
MVADPTWRRPYQAQLLCFDSIKSEFYFDDCRSTFVADSQSRQVLAKIIPTSMAATSQQKDLSASKINKSKFDLHQSMLTTLVLDTFFDAVG